MNILITERRAWYRFSKVHLSGKTFKAGLLLCIVFLMTACSKTDPDPVGTTLKVDRVSLKFGKNESVVLNIEYVGEWLAELDDDTWCELEKTSGVGNTALKISLKDRADATRKSAVLKIKSKANPSLSETVKLSIDEVNFVVSATNVEFGLGQLYYDVEIDYEGSWTVSLDNQTWCTIDKTTGKGKSTIRITNKDDMNQASGKTAQLTIAPADIPGVKATVALKQVNYFTHGSYLTLNKATVGKGIDIVIIGDGFTKEHMGLNGKWHDVAKKATQHIFDLEPYKSYRNHFNVYMVTAVSEGSTIGDENTQSTTFFKSYQDPLMANVIKPKEGVKLADFVYDNSPVKVEKGIRTDMFTCIFVNSDKFQGAANLEGDTGGRVTGTTSDVGELFRYIVTHEFTHAFAKLGDEYRYFGSGAMPEADKQAHMLKKTTFGHFQNMEFTDDPTKFFNQNWRKLLDMNYPGVGIHEGGFYFDKGVWRSASIDLMGSDGSTKLGAVNREIVLRQIYKIAGRASEYSFQTFLDYDKINL